jgi:hypothetical protein
MLEDIGTLLVGVTGEALFVLEASQTIPGALGVIVVTIGALDGTFQDAMPLVQVDPGSDLLVTAEAGLIDAIEEEVVLTCRLMRFVAAPAVDGSLFVITCQIVVGIFSFSVAGKAFADLLLYSVICGEAEDVLSVPFCLYVLGPGSMTGLTTFHVIVTRFRLEVHRLPIVLVPVFVTFETGDRPRVFLWVGSSFLELACRCH